MTPDSNQLIELDASQKLLELMRLRPLGAPFPAPLIKQPTQFEFLLAFLE